MGIRIVILLVFFLSASNCLAKWTGPTEIIHGSWGGSFTEFGLSSEDSGDTLPEVQAVMPNGDINIYDPVNNRIVIYGQDGAFVREVKYILKSEEDGMKRYELSDYRYAISNIQRIFADGRLLMASGGKYYLKSPSGQLIEIYDERPQVLGLERDAYTSPDGNYLQVIEYEDVTIRAISLVGLEKYFRDQAGNMYGVGKIKGTGAYPWRYRVYKYDKCSKVLGHIDLPENKIHEESADLGTAPVSHVTVEEEYGEPIIGPNGDIYCWKRTPETYSILKWTWVDDPNDPKGGPDAPANLKVIPSLDGLYLTWDVSPQDPGCVDGYEVERASTSGGIFNTVITVAHGVLKYNDTSALPGSTYYYRIRAKSAAGYSSYTAEASGKRIQ